MTVKIHIEVENMTAHHAAAELAELGRALARLLGDTAETNVTHPADDTHLNEMFANWQPPEPNQSHATSAFEHPDVAKAAKNEQASAPAAPDAEDGIDHLFPETEDEAEEEEPYRRRGEPAPGRQRRSGEQVAKDDKVDAMLAEIPDYEGADFDRKLESLNGDWNAAMDWLEDLHRKATNVASSEKAEEDAIDAALAAAEDDEELTGPKVTHQDIRDALHEYAEAFGREAALKDGPGLIGFPNVKSIPDDQGALGEALRRIRAELEARD